jgi:hypothetical protein
VLEPACWMASTGGLDAPCAVLQKLADEGRLNEPVAKTLNLGVLAASLGHLAGGLARCAWNCGLLIYLPVEPCWHTAVGAVWVVRRV